jgi:hypothetical protein
MGNALRAEHYEQSVPPGGALAAAHRRDRAYRHEPPKMRTPSRS